MRLNIHQDYSVEFLGWNMEPKGKRGMRKARKYFEQNSVTIKVKPNLILSQNDS